MKAPFLIGRLLFAGFFISSGINHLKKRKEMAEYARAKGVPQPELAVTLSADRCSSEVQAWHSV